MHRSRYNTNPASKLSRYWFGPPWRPGSQHGTNHTRQDLLEPIRHEPHRLWHREIFDLKSLSLPHVPHFDVDHSLPPNPDGPGDRGVKTRDRKNGKHAQDAASICLSHLHTVPGNARRAEGLPPAVFHS